MFELNPELRGNTEFQSALVRMVMWVFGVSYVGLGALTGYYQVDIDYFVTLCSIYLVAFTGMLFSVAKRPVWTGRCYVGLSLDISAVSLAIFLTKEAISPFYLFYIWIFISAGTRYGRSQLIYASVLSVTAYNLVLIGLGEWQRHTFEAIFFLLLLVLLPLYQYSLLRKLQDARLDAERANKAKGDFLAVMTHELRTPLTGVLGMSHLLTTTSLDAEQRGYLDSILSSAEVLRALIGDILDMSKIDARKLQLESKAFELRATLLEVCAALGAQALDKGLELVVRVDPRIPDSVIGDQLRVRQILFNLIGNAVKFTEQGEVRLAARLEPEDEGLGLPAHVLLEVTDTGIGIPEQKLDGIFEGFVQADDSTTRRYGGTGLGTTIAHDLTRLMGGRIGAESEEGSGSRFWVRLPLLPADVTTAVEPFPPRLTGRKALVYEKSASVRELIRDICATQGMECLFVGDPGQLSGMTDDTKGPDLLILGDSPSGQDLEALHALFIRVPGGQVPHLFLTYAPRRAALDAQRDRCLNKPFSAQALVSAILKQIAPDSAAAVSKPDPDGGSTRCKPGQPLAGTPVLVAEDNEIAAKVIATLLRKEGLEVTLVGDGEQALQRALEGVFAVAFIDLRMPKLDGIEFTRAYREAEPRDVHLPIVALTANAAEDVKEHCLAAGMDDFLGKPVRPQELIQMVCRYLPIEAAEAGLSRPTA